MGSSHAHSRVSAWRRARTAQIYNLTAGSLPGFKPATAEEIVRRYARAEPDAGSRYYAVDRGEIVGYAGFSLNGRISYPWCLPGADAAREPLLQTVLSAMKERNIPEAWAAYRADWSPVLGFLRGHGFLDKRQMINYVAEVSQLLPDTALPPDRVIEPMSSVALVFSTIWHPFCTPGKSHRHSSDSMRRIPSTISRASSSP